jgi:hypothetical protein
LEFPLVGRGQTGRKVGGGPEIVNSRDGDSRGSPYGGGFFGWGGLPTGGADIVRP